MKFGLRELEAVQVSAAVTRQRTGGERLEFILYTYQPGATFPVHQHEAEQLTLVVEGQLVLDFEDEVLAGCLLTRDGSVQHEPTATLLGQQEVNS